MLINNDLAGAKMESVTTQDIGVNDLRWIIDHRPERCTMCGSCVASCTPERA